MSIPQIDLDKLERDFGQLQRQGVAYGYGAKPEGGSDPRTGRRWNPNSTGRLSTPVSTIENIDCSGFIRFLLYRATEGALVIPDGSQPEREWCEQKHSAGLLHKIAHYADTNAYITNERLFIAFIKPWTNGCGQIGHVWLVGQFDEDIDAETMESYGGHGVGSRPWSSRTLRREVYSVYELPTNR
jgi:hypothetical protein